MLQLRFERLNELANEVETIVLPSVKREDTRPGH